MHVCSAKYNKSFTLFDIYTDNVYTSIYVGRAQYDMQLIGVYKTFIKSNKYVIRKNFVRNLLSLDLVVIC